MFKIQFTLASSAAQPDVLDKLKNFGQEVIQLSSGLLIKSFLPLEDIKKDLSLCLISSLSHKLRLKKLQHILIFQRMQKSSSDLTNYPHIDSILHIKHPDT